MKLINNTGTDRVIDVLRQAVQSGTSLDIASPNLSLFAFFELRDILSRAAHSRLILPLDADGDLMVLGSAADRAARNRLQARWLARECAKWIRERTEVRASSCFLPQSAYFIRHFDTARSRVVTGNCPLTTDGLGLAPGNHLSLIQCAETPEEVVLTLTDFRIDLAGFLKEHQAQLERLPLGAFAVITPTVTGEVAIPPGVIFCLRAEGEAAVKSAEPGYPLMPHYLVHVGEDGAALLPFTQAKQILDRLRRLCVGRDFPDAGACARFDKVTRNGENMAATQKLLAAAVTSIVGKKEERAVASLFTPGGTHAGKGEFAGMNDFEVVAFLVVLPEEVIRR